MSKNALYPSASETPPPPPPPPFHMPEGFQGSAGSFPEQRLVIELLSKEEKKLDMSVLPYQEGNNACMMMRPPSGSTHARDCMVQSPLLRDESNGFRHCHPRARKVT